MSNILDEFFRLFLHIPVSYTHLDVYKRQEEDDACSFQLERISDMEDMEELIAEAEELVKGIRFARDTVNTPGNHLRPMDFARCITGFVKDVEIEAQTFVYGQLRAMAGRVRSALRREANIRHLSEFLRPGLSGPICRNYQVSEIALPELLSMFKDCSAGVNSTDTLFSPTTLRSAGMIICSFFTS